MKHKTIQDQLLAYMDGEIPENQSAEIRRHLLRCEECQKLTEFWQEEKQSARRFSAPQYLWTRIQAELRQPAPLGWFDRLTASILPILQPAVAIATFILVVFIGVQIGEKIIAGHPQQSAQIRREFRMDYFTAVPSGSIGEGLVSFESGESEVSP